MNRTMFRSLCAACMACLLLLAGCSSEQQAPDNSQPGASSDAALPLPLPGVTAENYPRVDGSTSNMPLMAHVYSTVCGVSPEQAETMVYTSGGTGAAWRNMMGDGENLLLLVYEAPEGIKEEIAQQGLELEIHSLGRDGLVFLTGSQNPVTSLTTDQLRDIYTGKTTDWSQLGGSAEPIVPFQRNEESGSQTLFKKLLMQDLPPMQPPTELVPGTMGGLIEAIASFDGAGGAIGYSVYYYAGRMYEDPNLKLLAVDGVEPSTESIASGQYPLINDFYTVIRADAPANSSARLLRDWLLTDAGKAVLTSADYVPVNN